MNPQQKVRSTTARNISRAITNLTGSVFGTNSVYETHRQDTARSRSYEAAQQGVHLAQFFGAPEHINDSVASAFNLAKSRARHLAMNNSTIAKYLTILDTHLVGPDGFRLRVEYGTYDALGKWKQDRVINESIKNAYKAWCKRGVCEISGQHDFVSLTRAIARCTAIDGVSFVRLHKVKNAAGLALELVNVDRLNTSKTQRLPNGNRVVMGVEFDDNFKRIAYHLKQVSSGQGQHVYKDEVVPASEMLQVMKADRPEQLMSVTWLAPVLANIYQLAEADTSTLTAINIGAAQMGFLKSTTDDEKIIEALADSLESGEFPTLGVKAGQVTALPPNVELQMFDPIFPAASATELTTRMRADIANGLGLNAITLFGGYNETSFSGGRLATMQEREMFDTLHDWFINVLLVPVFENWLKSSLSRGIKRADGKGNVDATLFEEILECSKYDGRTWTPIDPTKDLEAYKQLVENGWMTRAQVCAIFGTDFETNIQELAFEADIARKANVYIPNVSDPLKSAELDASKEAAKASAAQAQSEADKSELTARYAAADANASFERTLALVKSSTPAAVAPSVHVGAPQITVEAPVVNVSLASKKRSVHVPVYDEAGLLVRMETMTEDVLEEDEEQEEKAIEAATDEVVETNDDQAQEPAAVEEEKTEEVVEADPAVDEEVVADMLKTMEAISELAEEVKSVDESEDDEEDADKLEGEGA
jgi:lambda family phage portal protein